MLCRASSSVLSLAIFRPFQGPLRIFHAEKGSRVPIMRFATETAAAKRSADQNLMGLLESEWQCADGNLNRIVGQENPLPYAYKLLWEVQDKFGGRNFVHKWLHRDEIIKVEVDIANVSAKNDEEGGVSDKPGFPLVVGVYKKHSELLLEFAVTAYLDKISVDNLSFKISQKTEDEKALWRNSWEVSKPFWDLSESEEENDSKYDSKEEEVDVSDSKKVFFDFLESEKGFGSEEDFAFEYISKLAPPKLDFQKLDQKLQEAFLEYLDLRGINHITTKYLYTYIVYKDAKEYANWLEHLKNFMEAGLEQINDSEEDF